VLREADLIACEDTRHTRKLLKHYAIEKPTISYHDYNEQERAQELMHPPVLPTYYYYRRTIARIALSPENLLILNARPCIRN